ncbi:MAG TPA: hypothetical protein VIL65_06740 [Beijerinckiaceae bacterium]|jgi:hypothetical protein
MSPEGANADRRPQLAADRTVLASECTNGFAARRSAWFGETGRD